MLTLTGIPFTNGPVYLCVCVCVGKDTGMSQYQDTGTLVYNDTVGVLFPFSKSKPPVPRDSTGEL